MEEEDADDEEMPDAEEMGGAKMDDAKMVGSAEDEGDVEMTACQGEEVDEEEV